MKYSKVLTDQGWGHQVSGSLSLFKEYMGTRDTLGPVALMNWKKKINHFIKHVFRLLNYNNVLLTV